MGRLAVIASSLLVVLTVGCAPISKSAGTLENRLVFHPHTFPEGDWSPDSRVEDVSIESTDGIKLHGWLAPSPREVPRAVVLYMHGNSGNVTRLRPVLDLYRDKMVATVLVFDYRGYGRSEGKPTETGVLADARAARRFLAAKTRVTEADIVIVGHSLGGGVAVDLASRDGARGLILEGTFTNLPDVAVSFVPLLPAHALMQARLDSIAKIPNYRGPLLQVHGDADHVVPYELGQKLFRAANEPKLFITVPNGDHTHHYNKEFVTALDRFLDSLPK